MNWEEEAKGRIWCPKCSMWGKVIQNQIICDNCHEVIGYVNEKGEQIRKK